MNYSFWIFGFEFLVLNFELELSKATWILKIITGY
jgi:hypothetical protein